MFLNMLRINKLSKRIFKSKFVLPAETLILLLYTDSFHRFVTK